MANESMANIARQIANTAGVILALAILWIFIKWIDALFNTVYRYFDFLIR